MMTSDITKAVSLLRNGGLVAFPTETVYGLGADAANESAIRRIFEAKERPFDHPLIVHIGTLAELPHWALHVSTDAMKLANTFWPGPLTIILKKQPHVLDIATGWQDTIGLRIPRHPLAKALLKAFKGGIAAPSANKFTHISPTTAKAVYDELGKEIDMVLDGGPCEVGLESTIIDMSTSTPRILRPGMITINDIETVLGYPLMLDIHSSVMRTPGMHHLHYAPTTKTVQMSRQKIEQWLHKAGEKDLPVAVLVRSPAPKLEIPGKTIHVVVMPNKAAAYAHDLYHTMRSLDNHQYKRIIVETVPQDAEWEAISDRLSKACAGSL